MRIDRISIMGPTLATIMQNFVNSAAEDCDGLLFGEVGRVMPQHLPDSHDNLLSPEIVATVAASSSFALLHSFYDNCGRIQSSKLCKLRCSSHPFPLIGWFVTRRHSPLRPSLREAAVSASLSALTSSYSASSSYSQSSSPSDGASDGDTQENRKKSEVTIAQGSHMPLLFFIFSESVNQGAIHTHEYRAFQYHPGSDGSSGRFEAKSVEVVNLGPGFRGNYALFSPISALPTVPWQDHATAKAEDLAGSEDKQSQRQLDRFSFDYSVNRLENIAHSNSSNSVSEVEDLYKNMISRLEHLANQVQDSSTSIAQQEQRNIQLRAKFSGINLV